MSAAASLYQERVVSASHPRALHRQGVRYEGTLYEGEHDAIVDADVWQQVQEVLRRNGLSGGRKVRNKHGALLKGLLYCTPCESGMAHAYTRKQKKALPLLRLPQRPAAGLVVVPEQGAQRSRD